MVSSNGISTDPDKIIVVENWPVPGTVKELIRFSDLLVIIVDS